MNVNGVSFVKFEALLSKFEGIRSRNRVFREIQPPQGSEGKNHSKIDFLTRYCDLSAGISLQELGEASGWILL